jgi:hypothetical protein
MSGSCQVNTKYSARSGNEAQKNMGGNINDY